MAGLAWIAPAVIMAAGRGRRGGERFRLGFIAGLAANLVMLGWLLRIPYLWHGIPASPALGWLLLSAFLAFYPALWLWLAGAVPGASVPPSTGGIETGLSPLTPGMPAGGLLARTLWALSGAAVWTALEMTQMRFLSGFPFNLLATSQYQMVPLIQVASLTGFYGVSFLIVWVSLSLYSAASVIIHRPGPRAAWAAEIFLPVVVMTTLFVWGWQSLKPDAEPARKVRVTLVQPSIPQTLIWDTGNDEQRFRDLVQLSERAVSNGTEIVIWPEASVPSYVQYDTNIYPIITNFVIQRHVWLILGGDDIAWFDHSGQSERREYYNAGFLIRPDGVLSGLYHKRHLVIFGEYIPWTDWLPFLKWFTPIEGGFTPGKAPARFAIPNLDIHTSVLICFEDAFPELGRDSTDEDTDFLVNITNNGWFGEGAAQWQHAASGIFRAVENGVPLLRCSNNGLTCWADAHGRIRQFFRDERGTIYGPGFMTADIPLRPVGEKLVPTFYHRHGDWLGWSCVAITIAFPLRRRLAEWRKRRAANSQS